MSKFAMLREHRRRSHELRRQLDQVYRDMGIEPELRRYHIGVLAIALPTLLLSIVWLWRLVVP